jgi:GAF domain-containing protein
VASIPLLHGGELVGIANCCRRHEGAFTPTESAFLHSVGVPLATLLIAAWTRHRLQAEVAKVSRQLADRKILERAKGLLRARHQWSEEDAYLHLRNTSRRRRTPLRQIAHEIIEGRGQSAAG